MIALKLAGAFVAGAALALFAVLVVIHRIWNGATP